MDIDKQLESDYANAPDKVEWINARQRKLHALSGFPHPVGCVEWHHVDKIHSNNYNPNSVA